VVLNVTLIIAKRVERVQRVGYNTPPGYPRIGRQNYILVALSMQKTGMCSP